MPQTYLNDAGLLYESAAIVYVYLLYWHDDVAIVAKRLSRAGVNVSSMMIFFFFQAEDGIRDYKVTGVQTCALPIYRRRKSDPDHPDGPENDRIGHQRNRDDRESGQADREHGPEHQELRPGRLGHGGAAAAPASGPGDRPGPGDRLHDGERRWALPAALPRLPRRDRLVTRVRHVDADDPRYAARDAELRPSPRSRFRDRAEPHPDAPGHERER